MENWTTLDAFYNFEKSQPNKVYLKQPIDGNWTEFTWKQVGDEARKLANAIDQLNLPKGSNIGLLSKNCAHWIITDLAIFMTGHVSVPLYPTSKSESIEYVLNHAEVPLCFIGKLDDWKDQKSGVPSNIKKVQFPQWTNEGCESWDDFTNGCTSEREDTQTSLDDLCTIIYTSGTTGNPKGVVHTFRSATTHIKQTLKKLSFNSSDRVVSYLPLSHVAERIFVEGGSLFTGLTISFVESLDTFNANIKETQPTLFLAVPRIWMKFQQEIQKKMPEKKLNLLLSIPIVKTIIQKKIKAALGLSGVRYAFSGAAALPKDTFLFFRKLGIVIQEAYGMTENFGISSLGIPGEMRVGYIGKVFTPNTQVKISEAGEILSKSDANMQGYYKNPEATAETINSEGWLHTGDKGEISPDGYLKITGRVKDAFKTQKGKFVNPSKIEEKFARYAFIDNICIVGSGLTQPVALICSTSSESQDALTYQIQEALRQVNRSLEKHEVLSHVMVTKEIWDIDNGLMTSTMKVKRHMVEAKYQEEINTHSGDRSRNIVFFGE